MFTNKKIVLWLKISLGVLSLLFIIYSLNNRFTDEHLHQLKVSFKSTTSLAFIIVSFILMPLNWGIESYKWKIITLPIQSISLWQSIQSVLSGICIGNLTPGRFGEFAGRILFFNPEVRSKIAVTHFVCGASQLIITLLFGISSLILLLINENQTLQLKSLLVASAVVFLIIMGLFFKSNHLYRWISKKAFLKKLNLGEVEYSQKTMLRLLAWSLIRNAVFTTQYFFILKGLGCVGDTFNIYLSIFISFMITSVVPMISFIEPIIRATIAVFLFSKFNTNQLQLITASSLIWFINIILPSIMGYLILLGIKQKTK